ncbi:valine--tRNA ligase [Fusibacter sp. 3D3]|uniref:valine--tRNA ligase n=1 Tax=Fusibacter sp. 3D3 TaxID=1048380 RepID=UPI00085356A7|nr:valine--tRNA ligase [Fusibacter sp. 3D3]GAU78236.1 valyl-tRNA synthetase [Fusibacter sp. 3D3]
MKKHYEHQEIESQMQALWDSLNIYKFDPNTKAPIYSIDTPPPTVSGSLHMGHIFSYAQGEMIARYKRMRGYNIFYPFGFDDNGLPTERLVEKEEQILAKNLSRSEFNLKCLDTTKKYEAEFKTLWQSLGFSVDWTLQYETINPISQRISQRSFIDLYEKGKVYHKNSPVLWCTECQTSIAQAELDAKAKQTLFNTLIFKTSDGEAIEIATTRPELLNGTTALFIHPSDNRHAHLIGKTAYVPLYNYAIPIIADDAVEIEKGSGIVMCATFGDITDLEWYEKHNLPYRKVIMPDGTISQETPFIGGLTVAKARHLIIDLLKDNDLLTSSDTIEHHVSTHERCGSPIEIIPSKQWYIDILTEKKRFLEAGDQINWYPAHMKNRYLNWVENLKWDWCISRQRYFGVPFPLWYCSECGKVKLADESQLPVNPLESNPIAPCSCGCNTFMPETAVLDTWATSSVTPQINALWGEKRKRLSSNPTEDERVQKNDSFMPMSMRTQAHEIIRTWAFYTIVKSLYHTGEIPWKDIMICGFVLAKKGEKISKSKNNATLSPQALIQTHSADAIRYWAATAKLGTDTFFSEDELGASKRFINKLWNASKFSISHLQDFSIENEMKLLPIDKWIIERCKETMLLAQRHLDQYELGLARHEIDLLFWRDFCDYYLEIVKDRLYKPEKHGTLERAGAQYALYISLLMILKLYAIFTPHITEYIYQIFYSDKEQFESLHQMRWCEITLLKDHYLIYGDTIKTAIAEVRKYKSEKALSLKSEIDEVIIECPKEIQEMIFDNKMDIIACCNAKRLILNNRKVIL